LNVDKWKIVLVGAGYLRGAAVWGSRLLPYVEELEAPHPRAVSLD
jgi:hypothetical protein